MLDEVPPHLIADQLVAEARRAAGVPVALYVVDIDGSQLVPAGRETPAEGGRRARAPTARSTRRPPSSSLRRGCPQPSARQSHTSPRSDLAASASPTSSPQAASKPATPPTSNGGAPRSTVTNTSSSPSQHPDSSASNAASHAKPSERTANECASCDRRRYQLPANRLGRQQQQAGRPLVTGTARMGDAARSRTPPGYGWSHHHLRRNRAHFGSCPAAGKQNQHHEEPASTPQKLSPERMQTMRRQVQPTEDATRADRQWSHHPPRDDARYKKADRDGCRSRKEPRTSHRFRAYQAWHLLQGDSLPAATWHDPTPQTADVGARGAIAKASPLKPPSQRSFDGNHVGHGSRLA